MVSVASDFDSRFVEVFAAPEFRTAQTNYDETASLVISYLATYQDVSRTSNSDSTRPKRCAMGMSSRRSPHQARRRRRSKRWISSRPSTTGARPPTPQSRRKLLLARLN